MFTPSIALSLLVTQKGPGIGSMMLSKRGDVEMMYVPLGKFVMGSTIEDDEQPVRNVFLNSYWMGRNDVTVGQFANYCQATGYQFRWNQQPATYWKSDHPMVNVTWLEAKQFCRWAGGDLPTEAQWEKAARGTDARNFPWGNVWDPTRGWFNSNQRCQNPSQLAINTVPVGSFSTGVSPYGCLDMAGQTFNWCSDFFDDKYDPKETKNPTGPKQGSLRVVRGGSWFAQPNLFRCAYRGNGSPDNPKFSPFGFRIAYRADSYSAFKLMSIISKATHRPNDPQKAVRTSIPPN